MKRYLLFSLILVYCVSGLRAQTAIQIADDEIPVLIKNLPDWESVFDTATITNKSEKLKSVLGPREVLDLIDFTGGTEAVTATYDEGKLLIVEYPTPQASIDADTAFTEKLAALASDPPTVYRRIGNFNVFLFDTTDAKAAGILLDKIKYEKTVQWLGKDPNYLQKAERYLARSLADMFVGTAVAIVSALGLAVLTGIVVGLLFYRYRDHRRASMPTFSDAGGMVRLNLDGFTPSGASDRLLND